MPHVHVAPSDAGNRGLSSSVIGVEHLDSLEVVFICLLDEEDWDAESLRGQETMLTIDDTKAPCASLDDLHRLVLQPTMLAEGPRLLVHMGFIDLAILGDELE
jgi:hypothetical protein